MNLTDIISNGRAPSENYMNGNDNIVIDKPDQQSALDQDSGLRTYNRKKCSIHYCDYKFSILIQCTTGCDFANGQPRYNMCAQIWSNKPRPSLCAILLLAITSGSKLYTDIIRSRRANNYCRRKHEESLGFAVVGNTL